MRQEGGAGGATAPGAGAGAGGGGGWRGASREELDRAERRAELRGGVSPPPELQEVGGVRRGFKADVLEQYRGEAAGAFARGQWAKAEFYLRQMLAIMAHVRGETLDLDSGEAVDHVDLAPVLYRMGQVAAHLLRFPEEERYLRRALRALEEAEGLDDRCKASMMRYRVLAELVQCLMRKERVPCAEAARLAFRALCLSVRMYGATNQRVTQDLVRLARCHALIAEYSEAETYLRRAHNISCRELGERHPETGRVLCLLSQVFKRMGQFDRAERYTRLFRLCPTPERFAQTAATYGEAFAEKYARTPLEQGEVPDFPPVIQTEATTSGGGRPGGAGVHGAAREGAVRASRPEEGGWAKCNYGLMVIDKAKDREVQRAARPRHIPVLDFSLLQTEEEEESSSESEQQTGGTGREYHGAIEYE